MENQEQDSTFMVTNININDLEIRVKTIEMQDLRAIVTVDFGDFSIKGFRVNNSNYENEHGYKLWIVPPSYRDGNGKYHPVFYITDKKLWKALEKRICQEYEKKSEEHFKKRMDID